MNLVKWSRRNAQPSPWPTMTIDQIPGWFGQFGYNGLGYGPSMIQTISQKRETIAGDYLAFINGAYKTSGPIFACMLVRMMLFSEARLQFQRVTKGRPGILFGTSDLDILEHPWPNATTGDLMARAINDVDLAGNFYCTRGPLQRAKGSKIIRLRPDWVTILKGSIEDADISSVDPSAELVGYIYTPGGPGSGAKPHFYLPEEICVDEATEMLTSDGWKGIDEVRVGDEALTLNHETGLTEWQRVSNVHIHPARCREVLLMEGKEHSSLTTFDHRWPVERRNARAGRYERDWVTSSDFSRGFGSAGLRIPVAGFHADLPVEPTHSDALVELVAWFWTEGSRRRKGRAIDISQSHEVNESNVARIRAALISTFGPARADKKLSHSVKRWNEGLDGDMTRFVLNSAASDLITCHTDAADKSVSTVFLRSLTQAQLDLFIRVSLLADNNGPCRICQRSKACAEQFALACLLAGHGVSIRDKEIKERTSKGYVLPGGMVTNVRMLRKQYIHPREFDREGSAFKIKRMMYEGRVWCPETPNHTWLARRKGSVYFTGNCHFAPIVDPAASYRGMSWVQPILNEVLGDKAMGQHKVSYFNNGATPNLVVSMDTGKMDRKTFKEWTDMFEAEHQGSTNAFRTLYLGSGSSATVVGSNLKDLDYSAVQGHGETRIAAAAGLPPIIVGFSEALSAATYSNYGQARRAVADQTLRPLWRNFVGSMETLVPPPGGSRLWYDDRDVAFLQADAQDGATVQLTKATAIKMLVDSGYDPDSVVNAMENDDFSLLDHSGLYSVQLQPAGSQNPGAVPVEPVPQKFPQPPTDGTDPASTNPPQPKRLDSSTMRAILSGDIRKTEDLAQALLAARND